MATGNSTPPTSPRFDESVKLFTVSLAVASFFISFGAAKFLSASDQEIIDVFVFFGFIIFAIILCASYLAPFGWLRIKILLRNVHKDLFWATYALFNEVDSTTYEQDWVDKWGLKRSCEQDVHYIIVDNDYKGLIVEPTPYPYEKEGLVFCTGEGFVRRFIVLANRKLFWEFNKGVYKRHSTASWPMKEDGESAMQEKTLANFDALFETDLKSRIEIHMTWLRKKNEQACEQLVISPCGFFISRGGLSYTSLRDLSIVVFYQDSKRAVVYMYNHISQRLEINGKEYTITKVQAMVTALSLWGCSPTASIHKDVTVVNNTLNTYCYSVEESIAYCMANKPIKLATIKEGCSFEVRWPVGNHADVHYIIVDNHYGELIVESTPYPYDGTYPVFYSKNDGEPSNSAQELFVGRFLKLANERLRWKFNVGEYKQHSTTPWPILEVPSPILEARSDSSSTVLDVDQEETLVSEIQGGRKMTWADIQRKTEDSTWANFDALFETDMAKHIENHMTWLRNRLDPNGSKRVEVLEKLIISPCGFFISKGNFAYTSLGHLSIVVFFKDNITASVFQWNHDTKRIVEEKNYAIKNCSTMVTALSLWGCSPTKAIHTNVKVEKNNLSTHSYTIEESIHYCMEGKPIKLATIHQGKFFDVTSS